MPLTGQVETEKQRKKEEKSSKWGEDIAFSARPWNSLNPLVQRDIAQIKKPITSAQKKMDGGAYRARTDDLHTASVSL